MPVNSSRILKIILLAGASVTACNAVAQIKSIERSGDTTQRAAPLPRSSADPAMELPPPRLQVDGTAPDTTGIWHFIRTNDAPAARRELARLQAAFPAWIPPA